MDKKEIESPKADRKLPGLDLRVYAAAVPVARSFCMEGVAFV